MAPLLPPDSALRVQLEGRWERIEQAQERYTALARQLGSRNWKHQLRSEPGLLAAVREQEPALDEVLAYVERRAQLEHWPKEHPGPSTLRGLRAQRARLEALGRKRLMQWGLQDGASFMQVLSGLEARVLMPVPQPPADTEPVLAEGRSWLSGGRFWLTPERLVWLSRSGEAEQLALGTLEPERISLLPGVGVRVEGDRQLTLAGVPRARSLAALLKLYSRKWQRGRAPTQELLCRRAYLDALGTGREQDRQWGMCLLRPGYLAFLPERRPTLRDWLLNLVGSASPSVPAELRRLDLLVKQLRKLPEEEFDGHLQEIIRVRGGRLWPSRELHRARKLKGEGPRILVRRQSVVGIQEARPELVDQYFQRHWPNAWRVASPSWWQRHSKALLLFGISVAGRVVPLFFGPDLPESSLFYLSYVPGLLAFSRYVRVKGHSPLLGLLSLLPCIGWLMILGLPDKNAPQD